MTVEEIVDEARVIIDILSEEGGTPLRHDARRVVLSPCREARHLWRS